MFLTLFHFLLFLSRIGPPPTDTHAAAGAPSSAPSGEQGGASSGSGTESGNDTDGRVDGQRQWQGLQRLLQQIRQRRQERCQAVNQALQVSTEEAAGGELGRRRFFQTTFPQHGGVFRSIHFTRIRERVSP